MTLEERLNKAEAMIQKPSFRQNKGLGNEVGYYIFDYLAEQELFVRERVEYIRKKMNSLRMSIGLLCLTFITSLLRF